MAVFFFLTRSRGLGVTTTAGEQALRAAKPLVDKSERRVLRGLSRTQIRELVSQLQVIVKAHNRRLAFPGVAFA